MSTDMPPRVVVGVDGTMPEKDFESKEHGTVEGTLYAIGHEVVGRTVVVSVDRAFPHDGKTIYQTKPLDVATELADGYAWAPAPDYLLDAEA